MTLKSRYSNMYVPSDFFNARSLWTEAFPMYRPFQLGSYCQFHVMHKDVEPLTERETFQEPTDADHLFSAKVVKEYLLFVKIVRFHETHFSISPKKQPWLKHYTWILLDSYLVFTCSFRVCVN